MIVHKVKNVIPYNHIYQNSIYLYTLRHNLPDTKAGFKIHLIIDRAILGDKNLSLLNCISITYKITGYFKIQYFYIKTH